MPIDFKKLCEQLNKIREDEGYCLSVTAEATRVLITGKDAIQITEEAGNSVEENVLKEFTSVRFN